MSPERNCRRFRHVICSCFSGTNAQDIALNDMLLRNPALLAAAQNVLDTRSAQREAISGVSMDEESIDLMQRQRAYQGAARLISVVDELMQTIIQMDIIRLASARSTDANALSTFPGEAKDWFGLNLGIRRGPRASRC
jgi:Flagellar basal body rod FlgEFG protein C-terminal